jgi:hypothetical protein
MWTNLPANRSTFHDWRLRLYIDGYNKTLQNAGEVGRKSILALIYTFHVMGYVFAS